VRGAAEPGRYVRSCNVNMSATRQFLLPPFAEGDLVTVRGARWVVDDVASFEDCALLQLSGTDAVNRRSVCRLLYPFDKPRTQAAGRTLRVVKRRRWMNALRSALADRRPFGALRAAAAADLEILAFQLEPALAFVRGLTTRALIADEVGLGKTIQAALIVAELANRGWAERVLILTPAGLRDQWTGELEHRFGIHAAVMDADSIKTRLSTLPPDVNPWAVEPVSIASLDFVKRAEVLQALDSLIWDVLVIDEAHLVAAAPQRGAAVRALARRARYLVLLTATPHDGNDQSFSSLCEIGRSSPEDGLLMFRRGRLDAGISLARKTHLLAVTLSHDEMLMHRLLGEYADRLWRSADSVLGRTGGRLVAAVLSKRALSSASSLARSIQRRLATFESETEAPFQASLLAGLAGPLDLEDDAEDADAEPELGWPGLEDRSSERRFLEKILEAAKRASCEERKLEALKRLLRRTSEPTLVFTEYRDTLTTVAAALEGIRRVALLHGGMERSQRRSALDAFRTGAADLLLATDAGCEGLNLQTNCRLVINLELPWNPVRLEQRVGRVDRIGQRRTVHAVHLYAHGTAENRVLARLFRRLERIRLRLGSLNEPLPMPSETAVAEAMIAGTALPLAEASAPDFRPRSDLLAAAQEEATRNLSLRALQTVATRAARAVPDGLLATAIRQNSRLHRAAGGPCAVCFVRARIADAGGRLIEEILIPVRSGFPSTSNLRRTRDVREAVQQLLRHRRTAILSAAEDYARHRITAITAEHGRGLLSVQEKESAIAKSLSRDRLFLVQPGLFDARTMKDRDRTDRSRRHAQTNSNARTARLNASTSIRLVEPLEPVLVLLIQNGRASCCRG